MKRISIGRVPGYHECFENDTVTKDKMLTIFQMNGGVDIGWRHTGTGHIDVEYIINHSSGMIKRQKEKVLINYYIVYAMFPEDVTQDSIQSSMTLIGLDNIDPYIES